MLGHLDSSFNKWQTPEAPPQGGETTKPRDQEPKQDHRHHRGERGGRIPWGGGVVWSVRIADKGKGPSRKNRSRTTSINSALLASRFHKSRKTVNRKWLCLESQVLHPARPALRPYTKLTNEEAAVPETAINPPSAKSSPLSTYWDSSRTL